MKKATPDYMVHQLCRVFETDPNTYYYQCQQKPVGHQEHIILESIKTIVVKTCYTYGKRRIHASLINQGFKLGIFRTATLMRKANVFATAPRKKHDYPNTDKPHIKTENILGRQFQPKTISTHQGWGYLACVLDLGSKEIVGWAMSRHPCDLRKDTLNKPCYSKTTV